MRLRTIIAIGAIAFNVWRSYRGMRKNVRRGAKTDLRRIERAI